MHGFIEAFANPPQREDGGEGVEQMPIPEKRTFFIEQEYSLIEVQLIRPNMDPVCVPVHIMEPGDRIRLIEERGDSVLIESRRRINAEKVLKGTFLILSVEWENFLSRKSYWTEITGLKKKLRVPAEIVGE